MAKRSFFPVLLLHLFFALAAEAGNRLHAAGFNQFSTSSGAMASGSVTTCNSVFFDPGLDNKYAANQDITMTFVPATSGSKIRVNFSSFSLEQDYDFLYVYDGPDTSAPLLAALTGYSSPGELVATGSGGELTFRFTSDGSVNHDGWSATVSCYEPGATVPAAPAAPVFSRSGGSNISISWTAPASYGAPITGYTLEQKENMSGAYSTVYSGTGTSFTLTGLSAGSTYFYRVKAHNSLGASAFSREVQYTPGQMLSGTVTACGQPFLDPGGSGEYPENQDLTVTYKPQNRGDKVVVSFEEFALENEYDILYVYDGPDINSPLKATLTGTNISSQLYASGAGGELTFRFVSDNLVNAAGWKATVSCATPGNMPPASPFISFGSVSDGRLVINWPPAQDNGKAVLAYSLEQKIGADGTYSEVYNGTALTFNASVSAGEVYSFRLRASNVNGSSGYSNELVYTPGQMLNGSMAACGLVFTDPGGAGNYSNNTDQVLTLVPGSPAEKVRVRFSSFSLEADYDFLHVYDGPSTSSPLIASFTGNSLPDEITSTAASGELTFRFASDESGSSAGWEANVSCFNPYAPGVPNPVAFEAVTDSSAIVTWQAPAGPNVVNSYTLQRKTEPDGSFETVYSGNTLSFTDSELTAGLSYSYRVNASNTSGSSDYSTTASVCIPFRWYRDADKDLFGDPDDSSLSCLQPDGFVSDSSDCDDTNSAINPKTTWYLDADGDGFGTPDSTVESCSQPNGYVMNQGDCDDTNAEVTPEVSWYRDADGDGYGDPAAAEQFCTEPEGYVRDNTDCDDTNSAINPKTVWYLDADGDGYGTSDSTMESCHQPDGYVLSDGDCNDSDSSINPGVTWYLDADGDSYGNAAETVQSCIKPDGFTNNAADCDDSDATIFPGASDLAKNCNIIAKKTEQTITFPAIGDLSFAPGLGIKLEASSDSGLPVSFSVSHKSGVIKGDSLLIYGPGNFTVTASQMGNDEYAPAKPVSQSFCVNPPPTSIEADLESRPPLLTAHASADDLSFNWYLDGNSLVTAADSVLVVARSGVYRVNATAGTCAGPLSDELPVAVEQVTSVAAESFSDLQLYPNPASDIVHLSAENTFTGRIDLAIYSVDGQTMKTMSFEKTAGEWAGSIAVAELPPGIYLLKIVSEGQEVTRKMIKE